MSSQEQDSNQPSAGFISIERVVAFVLGPIVIAASGWLSSEAARIGVKVSAGELKVAFATGGFSAGALIWKWLHGRQKTPVLLNDGKHVLNTVSGVVEDLGIGESQQQTIERTVIGTLEEHAAAVAGHLAQHIRMTAQTSAAEQPIEDPAAEPPIPPAQFDPAPATPVAAVPPTADAQQPETPPAGAGG